MVFFSTKSRDKVYHQSHCIVRNRINHTYEKWFPSPEEARSNGYRMCNYCSLAGTMLRREKTAVDSFCLQNDVTYDLKDGVLHVRTANSDWIITEEGAPRRIRLYHKNTLEKLEELPSEIPGYHPQNAHVKTITEALWYIIGHDRYREKAIIKAKEKKKKMHDLRSSTWKYQKGKGRSRVRANQLYSLLDKEK